MIKKKYIRKKNDLINSLNNSERQAIVLSIEVIETSKIKDHLIYECEYLDNGTQKQINIIARDITEALVKLEPYVGKGIPDSTTGLILGSHTFQGLSPDHPDTPDGAHRY